MVFRELPALLTSPLTFLWPPRSPDCDPLDYFVWSAVEAAVNKMSNNTVDQLKAAMSEEKFNMDSSALVKVCSSFRPRLEQVVEAEGGHFERTLNESSFNNK